jgi:NADH-quinone oxidoreductase subunit L
MFENPLPYLWLVPALPLFAAALTALVGKRLGSQAHWPCLLGALGACFFAVCTAVSVGNGFAGQQVYYTWFQIADLNATFSLRADGLTAVMLVTVTFIGSLIVVFSIGYMHGDPGYPRFFAVVSLFLFAMTLLVTADNFLLLYAGWEGVGVCSYLLIGYWFTKPSAATAARKAFLVTRLGDIGLFIGIALLWDRFHTLDMNRIFEIGGRDTFLVGIAASACSSGRQASRPSSRCTSGCRTPWKARRRCRP